MYARRLNSKCKRWGLISQQYKHVVGSDRSFGTCCQPTAAFSNCSSQSVLTRRYLSESSLFRTLRRGNTKLWFGSNANWSSNWLRYYSSEGDGRNANEDKCVPLKDVSNVGNDKIKTEKLNGDISLSDGHARLGEQDQKDWLHNEKITIENKRKEYPFLSRREKFKKEFSRRIVPWEKITVSWKTFPYFLHEHTKKLLVECAASHLKHKDCTAAYGAGLTSSSGRILLQSIPGTELYRERVVRALAQDLQVPLLVLDSSVLAPYDFGEECLSESESDEDNAESGAETTSETEIEDENDASNEEDYTSSGEAKSDGDVEGFDARAAAVEAALNKLVPGHLEDFEKNVMGNSDSLPESPEKEASKPSDESKRQLKKGDRVKYVGPSRTEADNRPLSPGQRGLVCEMNGNVALVLLEGSEKETTGGASSDKLSANHALHWIQAKDIIYDLDAEAEDCYVAMEALSEVLHSVQPLIVYFPDFSIWLSRAVTKANRKAFAQKVQEIFDQVSGPVVLICGQNKGETGSKEKEKYTMILPNLGRLAKLPLSLKRLTEGLKPAKKSEDDEIYKLFTNVMVVHPPKEEDPLRTFNKQIEEDRRIVISRSNITELHKVLEENGLLCVDLLNVNADGVILTKSKAEKVVGWAKNHYLSSCLLPLIKGEKLHLPRESLEIALTRLKEQETISKKPSHTLKNLAKDEYESNFVSAVVPPDEVGVKFDDIGALEDVKTALNELVILPMRRPELFSRGNLLRPCKGILLFGPPGTGKTLLAKALATEAGANFISITGSTLTSKWFGDAEKLTKALFSFAGKLAPVIIFVDEVDSLLGARGGSFEHEATRRMRNEFMAAWDGLRTKDSQRILILGATNRPFDLDDAVIRRLPRRIYVDLPDADNRLKILKIFLDQEDLEPEFQMQQLANATEGYSGSDLKNLCRAAAYRPVQELLEKERKGVKDDVASILRPLSLDDFIQSKAKIVEKLVDIVTFIHQDILEAFGDKGVIAAEKPSNNPERLGVAGLALHYAHIITQIDNIACRPTSLPPNTRDGLYNGLPISVKTALRSRLQTFDAKEELTVPQIKAEMEKTLQWLVPIAADTTKAHQGFGWVGEWANTGMDFGGKKTGANSSVIRLQTLYHADKQKMDQYILELVIFLHRLINVVGYRDNGFKALPVRSPTNKGVIPHIETQGPSLDNKYEVQEKQLSSEDRNLLEEVVKQRKMTTGRSKSQEFVMGRRGSTKVWALSRSTGSSPRRFLQQGHQRSSILDILGGMDQHELFSS